MGLLNRYHDALKQIPPPGCGCHISLLSVANLGVLAGLDGDKIFEDIREHIPPGNRKVSDREIQDATKKALADHHKGTFTSKPKPAPVVHDGKTALQRIIEQSEISDESVLWELSPIRLYDEPEKDTALFLSTLFKPDDLLWIDEFGEVGKPGENIQPALGWIDHFQNGGKTAPHVIVKLPTGAITMHFISIVLASLTTYPGKIKSASGQR
jgi:hypothetical protein